MVVLAPPPRPRKDAAMPKPLAEQLGDLERWAEQNGKDARHDAVAFWTLKIPAIVASASAGLMAHFDLTSLSVVVGTVASLCIIVDGVHPRGMLRNAHLRAHHDIRNLTIKMTSQWRSRDEDEEDETTYRKIIREAEAERNRIATFVRDAETALSPKDTA
jgi:uncharacterized membrane protein YgaE (UPF0421/DUF939 family)